MDSKKIADNFRKKYVLSESSVPFPKDAFEILFNIEDSGLFTKYKIFGAKYDDVHYKDIPMKLFVSETGWDIKKIEKISDKGREDEPSISIHNGKVSITGGA